MYLSDFNMMLENNLVDCFSEISLDKDKINELYNNEKCENLNNYQEINNDEDVIYEKKINNKKLKEKIIHNLNNTIYGKENKTIVNRNRKNNFIESSTSDNTRRISKNFK
jgi:hypothetical protein